MRFFVMMVLLVGWMFGCVSRAQLKRCENFLTRKPVSSVPCSGTPQETKACRETKKQLADYNQRVHRSSKLMDKVYKGVFRRGNICQAIKSRKDGGRIVY